LLGNSVPPSADYTRAKIGCALCAVIWTRLY
jgi:hypothetical protein